MIKSPLHREFPCSPNFSINSHLDILINHSKTSNYQNYFSYQTISIYTRGEVKSFQHSIAKTKCLYVNCSQLSSPRT